MYAVYQTRRFTGKELTTVYRENFTLQCSVKMAISKILQKMFLNDPHKKKISKIHKKLVTQKFRGITYDIGNR